MNENFQEVGSHRSRGEELESIDESDLNPESFASKTYSQKIRMIQYIEKIIQKTSQQGRRSDLVERADGTLEEKVLFERRHKSVRKSRRPTTRDRVAQRLGISTATLSKFRRIIKLPDDLLDSLTRLLDEKKITLETAYRMPGLSRWEIELLIECIHKSPDKKIDLERLKKLSSRGQCPGTIPVCSRESIKSILVPRKPK